MNVFVIFIVLVTVAGAKWSRKIHHNERYSPTWDSLDSRPIPEWYQNSKFGIFCHWGVYSVPAYRDAWFWWYWKGSAPDPDVVDYARRNFNPHTSYADFAPSFSAEFFNPESFKDIVVSSGARYFVLTSKHHEGFTLWPSQTSWNWNSVDVGPHRNIVGELKKAFSGTSVHFGLYFSQFEWFNRYFTEDSVYNTSKYVKYVSYPQMLEIVNSFEPEIIWSDGDWGKSDDYWKSKEFLAWLYNDSPVKDTVVVNDRWGEGDMGKHGGFLTYSDHFDPGHLLARKWENCLTLDRFSWGNRRNMRSEEVLSVAELIEQLVRTIACNGNMLLNVGPDKHGMIPAIFEDRLRELGVWVRRNEEAIFSTHPWMHQNDSDIIWYTVSLPKGYRMKPNIAWTPHVDGSKLYAFILKVPTGKISLPSVRFTSQITAAALLDDGKKEELEIEGSEGEALQIDFSRHQRLAAFPSVVVCIEHFDADYHDPIKTLKMRGILDAHGRPTRIPQQRRRSEGYDELKFLDSFFT